MAHQPFHAAVSPWLAPILTISLAQWHT